MARKERDECRHVCFEALEQRHAFRVEPLARIKLLPKRGDARPLRMRVERLSHRGAELDAQPWRRMGIVEIDAEDEGTRQADDADQAECRDDADPRDRPEIGDDFGDPALPYRPDVAIGDRPRAATPAARAEATVPDRAGRRPDGPPRG